MRCVCCDEPLSSYEMGLKSKVTGENFWMKVKCLKEAGLLQDDDIPQPSEPVVEEDVYMSISGLDEEFE